MTSNKPDWGQEAKMNLTKGTQTQETTETQRSGELEQRKATPDDTRPSQGKPKVGREDRILRPRGLLVGQSNDPTQMNVTGPGPRRVSGTSDRFNHQPLWKGTSFQFSSLATIRSVGW
ncbi:hypothetical protein VTJ04DRAFT_2308 [Mycothermus thermophilus]|uniref:uncharacterized protein n=1 Tax=Humicola insolens TaxID=85995 RepID=UPI0037438EBA